VALVKDGQQSTSVASRSKDAGLVVNGPIRSGNAREM